jgi:hypothetical protein
MRRSKLTIALLFSLFIPMANAEDMAYLLNSTPTERAASQTRFMKTKLSLSQDDATKIQIIKQEYAEKIEPVLKGSSIGLLKIHDIKAIWEQKDDTLRSVLTSEQFDVYTNAKDELKQAMRQILSTDLRYYTFRKKIRGITVMFFDLSLELADARLRKPGRVRCAYHF